MEPDVIVVEPWQQQLTWVHLQVLRESSNFKNLVAKILFYC